MKLRVRNFQALEDVKLDVEGLTVVTGRSNLGKTSLIRAIAAMFFGLPGDYYVRRGQDFVGGAIAIDDGQQPLKIVWRKVPATKRKPTLQPVLQINGTEHTKIGKDHKDLTKPYGILEIETSQARLRPQIAMQHDPIFLIGETETTAAEVFKMLGRVDVITEAQRLAKKDLRSDEDKRKIRSLDLNTATERRDKLSHIPALRKRMDELKDFYAKEERGIEKSREMIQKLTALSQLEPVHLPTPPEQPVLPDALTQVKLLRELSVLVPRKFPEPPSPSEIPTALKSIKLLEALVEATKDWENTHQQKETATTEIKSHEETLKGMEAELGTCPVCKRSFDAEHRHP